MTYEKPEILAQNSTHGSFAAGCPPQGGWCKDCERTS